MGDCCYSSLKWVVSFGRGNLFLYPFVLPGVKALGLHLKWFKLLTDLSLLYRPAREMWELRTQGVTVNHTGYDGRFCRV